MARINSNNAADVKALESLLLNLSVSAAVLLCMIFSLLGIKLWRFKHRMRFDHSSVENGANGASTTPTTASPTRRDRKMSQQISEPVAVTGVFRKRAEDDMEIQRAAPHTNAPMSARLSYSTPNLAEPEPEPEPQPQPEPQYATVNKPTSPRIALQSIADVNIPPPPTREPPKPPIESAEFNSSIENMPAPPGRKKRLNREFSVDEEQSQQSLTSNECCLPSTEVFGERRPTGYIKYEEIDFVAAAVMQQNQVEWQNIDLNSNSNQEKHKLETPTRSLEIEEDEFGAYINVRDIRENLQEIEEQLHKPLDVKLDLPEHGNNQQEAEEMKLLPANDVQFSSMSPDDDKLDEPAFEQSRPQPRPRNLDVVLQKTSYIAGEPLEQNTIFSSSEDVAAEQQDLVDCEQLQSRLSSNSFGQLEFSEHSSSQELKAKYRESGLDMDLGNISNLMSPAVEKDVLEIKHLSINERDIYIALAEPQAVVLEQSSALVENAAATIVVSAEQPKLANDEQMNLICNEEPAVHIEAEPEYKNLQQFVVACQEDEQPSSSQKFCSDLSIAIDVSKLKPMQVIKKTVAVQTDFKPSYKIDLRSPTAAAVQEQQTVLPLYEEQQPKADLPALAAPPSYEESENMHSKPVAILKLREPELFAELETVPQHEPTDDEQLWLELEKDIEDDLGTNLDEEFNRIRYSYDEQELQETRQDLKDLAQHEKKFQRHKSQVCMEPQGFGKTIEEDWHNFENLDEVKQNVQHVRNFWHRITEKEAYKMKLESFEDMPHISYELPDYSSKPKYEIQMSNKNAVTSNLDVSSQPTTSMAAVDDDDDSLPPQYQVIDDAPPSYVRGKLNIDRYSGDYESDYIKPVPKALHSKVTFDINTQEYYLPEELSSESEADDDYYASRLPQPKKRNTAAAIPGTEHLISWASINENLTLTAEDCSALPPVPPRAAQRTTLAPKYFGEDDTEANHKILFRSNTIAS